MVSVGTLEAQREEVAKVATTVFGKRFTASQIVNEKLRRSLEFSGELPDRDALSRAIAAGVDFTAGEPELRSNPVAVWLENRIALEEKEGQPIRRKPLQVGEVVDALSKASGQAEPACKKTIADLLHWISSVNQTLMTTGSRYTILPFKLHQFIAQTGSVYTTLDQDESNRFITLEPGIYKQDDENKKRIYPNVFSRATGQPFLCVSLADGRLEPREFRASSNDEVDGTDQKKDGYLIVGQDVWNPEIDLEDLPEAWLRRPKSGPVVPDSKKVGRFPRKLWFNEYGEYADAPTASLNLWGWFMTAPLLFDPTGGVVFDPNTNEGTKLTKLGSEGRSTSTTITAFSILNRLHDAGYPAKDQKVLSFTDNVQDAALQAGHFNDFAQVVQLRSAILKALKAAPDQTLTYSTIGESVFKSLDLPFLEFANRDSEPILAPVRRDYEQALQSFLFYRAVADLRRSWRIVLPNLEQCALLSVDYQYLDDVASHPELWTDVPVLRDLSNSERRGLLETILDFFRLEYALHSENYLTPSRLKENEKQFRERLKAPWTLDHSEEAPRTLCHPFRPAPQIGAPDFEEPRARKWSRQVPQRLREAARARPQRSQRGPLQEFHPATDAQAERRGLPSRATSAQRKKRIRPRLPPPHRPSPLAPRRRRNRKARPHQAPGIQGSSPPTQRVLPRHVPRLRPFETPPRRRPYRPC